MIKQSKYIDPQNKTLKKGNQAIAEEICSVNDFEVEPQKYLFSEIKRLKNFKRKALREHITYLKFYSRSLIPVSWSAQP